MEDGKKTVISTEEVIRPDGSREITETINEGGKISTNKYNLAKGEEKPKQLGHKEHKDHKDDKDKKEHKEIKN